MENLHYEYEDEEDDDDDEEETDSYEEEEEDDEEGEETCIGDGNDSLLDILIPCSKLLRQLTTDV